MELKFRPLHPLFVAEVSPIDLRQVRDAETLARIRAGMDEYAVLVFRDQPFADDEQLDFAQRLDGVLHTKLGISALQKNRFGNEALGDISNLDENGEIMKSDNRRRMYSLGNRLWHTDASFQDPAGRYSMLSAKIVPPVAADTEYADMRAAYDCPARGDEGPVRRPARAPLHRALAADPRLRVLGERAGGAQGRDPSPHPRPPTLEPALPVRRLPRLADHRLARAGRTAPPPRSHRARHPATVRLPHEWRVGDLVIWDNRATMHRGKPFDDTKHRRELRRVTTLDIPEPAAVVTGRS
jgi:Probable taurine catabolism dioxygenase